MSDVATRAVSGPLTFDTVPGLYQSSSGWFEGGGDLVIDLARVSRTDSAGLALMIEWLRRAKDANCKLRFVGIPAQVQTLIRVNGLENALLTSAS